MHAIERLPFGKAMEAFDAERKLAQCKGAFRRQSAFAQPIHLLGYETIA